MFDYALLDALAAVLREGSFEHAAASLWGFFDMSRRPAQHLFAATSLAV